MKHNVMKIDSKNKKIRVQDLTTQEIFEDSYDKLIMTTGSEVGVPPIGGMDNPRVLLCKSYAQAKKIYESALDYPSIAIVGAGYVGVELAESYANTVHEVTLIQSRETILNNYVDEPLSETIIQKLKEHDVKVQLGERVAEIDDGEQLTIKTKAGHAFKADLVIVCTGFFANTDLLRGQVQMDGYGAILVNDYMQTSDPDIYAAGDSTAVKFNPTGEMKYIPLASSAVRQGTLAGMNIFGKVRKYMGTQATTAMGIFGYTLAETGLTLKKALANGLNADCVTYHDYYRPEYMPTTEMLTIYLIYDKDTRKVLGAQLFSKHEVAQSANAISICIQNENTIDDLAYVDMLFQPNYDNPFNYLNLVAQMAIDKEDNEK